MYHLELTEEEARRLDRLVTTAMNSARGRKRHYEGPMGAETSNTPEMEAAHASAELQELTALRDKIEALSPYFGRRSRPSGKKAS